MKGCIRVATVKQVGGGTRGIYCPDHAAYRNAKEILSEGRGVDALGGFVCHVLDVDGDLFKPLGAIPCNPATDRFR